MRSDRYTLFLPCSARFYGTPPDTVCRVKRTSLRLPNESRGAAKIGCSLVSGAPPHIMHPSACNEFGDVTQEPLITVRTGRFCTVDEMESRNRSIHTLTEA
ncbi:hypothetical protein HPB48_005977 [Haemaphysalis longicornis]|uniref:Uncharacterized protein n=1 Tax=Haemaphysalis longicornis TaxID=44386 RepID=A0A9J6FK81_HAELO|nr:hypothetical protein HPB48_005977 [Haemaphysalis longicornis]